MDKYKQPVILKLDGRMSNQMFEWAFARGYEHKNGNLPFIDDSKETLKLSHFNLIKDLKTVKKPFGYGFLRKCVFIRALRNKFFKLSFKLPEINEENVYKYQEELLHTEAPKYINGYFQTEKYFSDIKEKIEADFTLKDKLNHKNKDMLEKIRSANSVAVHFRRGDYTKQRIIKTFGYCSLDYYYNAVKLMKEKTTQPCTLFIFSDDIKWVKSNVKFDCETVYVDINSSKQGYYDLELMKNCKHNIIANSTFSWWGAWLNKNPEKIVIAPKTWVKFQDNFYDLYPENWIKLEN